METTDDAEPTMTSPMRQSRTTSRSSKVETETRRLPRRMPMPAPRSAARCADERGAVVAVFVGRRGLGDVCRRVGAARRVEVTVIAPTRPGRGRAALTGPTPDAHLQSPPPRLRSGGPRRGPGPRGACQRGSPSRELRHGEVVPVEDAEPERTEEPAKDPEADDHRRLRPAA